MNMDCYYAVLDAVQKLLDYQKECPSQVPKELTEMMTKWITDHCIEALNELEPLQNFSDD